jgi:nitrate reductase NapE component
MTNTKKRTKQTKDSKIKQKIKNISWKKAAVILFGVLMMVLWPIAGVLNI